MRRIIATCACGLAAAATVLAGSAGTGEKGGLPLPKETYEKLIAHDAKAVQDALAKGKLDRKTSRRAKAAALMIAVYAQAQMAQGGANAADLASLREAALDVHRLIEDDKVAEAKARAADLTGPRKGGAGKGGPLALEKVTELLEVMKLYSSVPSGGFGMEKELSDLENVRALQKPQLESLALLAAKSAAIGHVAAAFTEGKNAGGMQTVDNWLAFAAQMKAAGLETAAAARAGKTAEALAGLKKLNQSCVKCHDVFR